MDESKEDTIESPKEQGEVNKDSFEFTHSPILDRNNKPYANSFEIREDVQDRIE